MCYLYKICFINNFFVLLQYLYWRNIYVNVSSVDVRSFFKLLIHGL